MSDQRKPWTAEVLGTLTRNPWFGVLLQNVTMPDGSTTRYYTLDFPNPAVGVVVRRGDEFLLIHQYRFIVNEQVWAIPSGGAQEGESPEQAAAREMEEETGYRPSKPLDHILEYYPSYGCSNQRFELFVAEDPVLMRDGLDANEVMGSRWFKTDEILEMIRGNQIVDGLSLTPLLLLLLRERADSVRNTR